MTVFDNSQVNVSGGVIYQSIFAAGTSRIHVSGGTIAPRDAGGTVLAADHSVFTMTGGTLVEGALQVTDSGEAYLRGGDPGDYLLASLGGTIHLYGVDLQATLTDEDPFAKTYTLSGTLEDGTDLSGRTLITRSSGSLIGSFVLHPAGEAGPLMPAVPEPGSLALIGCAVATVAATTLLGRKHRH